MVLAKVTPAGKVSTKGALSVAELALLLLSVIVSTLTSPADMALGVKLFATVGGMVMVKSAVLVATLLPWLVCSAPANNVLVKVPTVLLVTFAVMVQLPLAGIVAPFR